MLYNVLGKRTFCIVGFHPEGVGGVRLKVESDI